MGARRDISRHRHFRESGYVSSGCPRRSRNARNAVLRPASPPPYAPTGFGWQAIRRATGRRVSPEAPQERRETGVVWYVYFLELKNGDIYLGSTNDLRRRFTSHQQGEVVSHKQVFACGPAIVCGGGKRTASASTGTIFQVRFRQSVRDEAAAGESRPIAGDDPLGRQDAFFRAKSRRPQPRSGLARTAFALTGRRRSGLLAHKRLWFNVGSATG